jgi:hypothetical protein
MILTMLYRMEGCPFDEALAAVVPEDDDSWTLDDFGNAIIQSFLEGFRSGNGFPDVEAGAYYEVPILWAMLGAVLDEYQIDAETREIHPAADCPRGEMVFFLYRASGDAPVDGAIDAGRIPETVLLDKDGVTVTATGIRSEGLNDVIVDLSVVNGSGKLLRVDADELYVNTYYHVPQVCIPTEDEDGWVFYADAVVAPGETKDCELRLNALDEICVYMICELEFRTILTEVAEGEYGYDYVDEFAAGDTVCIRTSLYDESAAYDMEGPVLLDRDGLQVRLVNAENTEFAGPEITLYIYNGGSEDVYLELAELKLDGESWDAFFGVDRLAAGKRCVAAVSAFIMDYDNIPTAGEAELTLRTLDPETWETKETFAPVKVTIPN